ncbi:MAG: hypothetical protein LBC29_03915 [Propionibacteriaceae bacterium]|jgi:hypothetical protein|nr:hypothetical protein [Propionibacteriaceae bacterium]
MKRKSEFQDENDEISVGADVPWLLRAGVRDGLGFHTYFYFLNEMKRKGEFQDGKKRQEEG